MMNQATIYPLCAALLLAACAAPKAPESAGVPYPEPDIRSEINRLDVEIARLQQQNAALEKQLAQLQSARRAPKPQVVRFKESTSPEPAAPARISALAAAQAQYRQNNFAGVLRTLNHIEGGGSGSDEDRQGMYLLLQSHRRLNHCESVINIGRRYASLFRSSAAEALFAVGECQWKLQQKDIARDTWRSLMRSHPGSAAAKKAEAALKKR